MIYNAKITFRVDVQLHLYIRNSILLKYNSTFAI